MFLFPCRLQSKACLVTLLVCFRRVFPTHFHFLLAIPFQMLCWTVLPRFVCLWVFCHLLFRMYLRHILMNVCSTRLLSWLLSMSQIQIAVHLKIQILFRVEKDDVFHTVFKMLNACLAFPILFLTFTSVPTLSITTLPR